jgi:hypothetical protein
MDEPQEKELQEIELQKAYEMVLNDLTGEDAPSMFRGTYDAKNGNDHFMYGISTVMEFIAYRASDARGDEFGEEFVKNMLESEKKYGVGMYAPDVDDGEGTKEDERV